MACSRSRHETGTDEALIGVWIGIGITIVLTVFLIGTIVITFLHGRQKK